MCEPRINWAPKTCCCKWPLEVGAKVVAILHCLIMVVLIVIPFPTMIYDTRISVDLVNYQLGKRRLRIAYAIMTVIYSIALFMLNLALFWGIVTKKKRVVFAWLVVTLWWMATVTCFLLVLLGLFFQDTLLVSWIFSFIAAIVAVGILIYTWFVVYGFLLHLNVAKSSRHAAADT